MRGTQPRQPGALVVGADLRALGIVRSLGRQHIPVAVARYDFDRIALTSRYVTHRSWDRLPSGEDDAVKALLELADRNKLGGWVLFATDDESSALISRRRDELDSRFRVTAPPWEILTKVYDKATLNRHAHRCGVEVPFSVVPCSREYLREADLPFPVILKPRVKRTSNPLTRARAWRADDRATLLARYDEARRYEDSLLVQELLPGGGDARFSYAALCRDGEPLASLVAQRIRQYPVEFGRHSTYVETIDDPRVEEAARALLAHVRYTGLVEVEFHRDPRTNSLKLLDVNHRVWGWHTIGAAAGVDFAYLEWQMQNGLEFPFKRGKPGIRWRRAATDAIALTHELFVERELRTLRTFKRANAAVWQADDPVPALADIGLTASKVLRRRMLGN
jgi:D-aspartate ligase